MKMVLRAMVTGVMCHVDPKLTSSRKGELVSNDTQVKHTVHRFLIAYLTAILVFMMSGF